MKWITTLTEWDDSLTDKNHIFTNKDKIFEIYEKFQRYIEPKSEAKYLERINTYNGFGSRGTVVVHKSDNDVVWEALDEFVDRLESFKQEVKEYNFGYIMGTHHPLGSATPKGMQVASKVSGYQMWEKITY